ncbi:MAG: ATP-binding protein [Eggerthellaceae bacterium]|jgi:hypothetical protein
MGINPLADFIDDVSNESHLRVEADLGDGFVRLKSEEAERRQAIHDIRSSEDIVIELLRNARDAHASHIFLATSKSESGNTRHIVMVDDGDGIPPSMHEKVFEPRVTSKLDTMHLDKWGVHGRGMALYSVKVNADRAYIASSALGRGTALVVDTNLNSTGEKADQSTFPRFELDEGRHVSVHGPRNILRTSCEFAIDSRHQSAVYVGSITNIASTLYHFGRAQLSAKDRAFISEDQVLLTQKLALAPDPATFIRFGADLGLDISERSARRIMDGEIEALPPLLDLIQIKGLTMEGDSSESPKEELPVRDARGLKISPSDMDDFSEAVARAFQDLSEKYYLHPQGEPQIRVGRDGLHISLPYTKDN